ncbi:Ig-like domain-containing protein [Bacillus solitudinis]|uniref:Ig-like domain-containing protein n=1 Tax=Bacillus solitudinis TaxID=2014074 RepID=UPI000C23AA7A|nr:Ig-like domain-containing protein [Bacillus solitudinis]
MKKKNNRLLCMSAIVTACMMVIVTPGFSNTEGKAKVTTNEATFAFPGAEGGGRYASGGRGYEIYEVTTLEDYASDEEPIAGSFRHAVSEGNRTIVFRTSGTIHLKERLSIKQKNLTIAGQTAPGDGIALAGYETNISESENMIIRYMRFRAGSEGAHTEPDSFGGRDVKNVIIDHVSASWGVDEGLSFYRNEDTTVQWSIISESLVFSEHVKGRHGYGGIWGGRNATFANNLISHHVSRMPALGNGGPKPDPVPATDIVNNVIYNWGFNSTYGGEELENNIINNYYKPGPGTRDAVNQRIVSPGRDGHSSWFYIDGNVMHNNSEVSTNNQLGIEEIKSGTVFSDIPFAVSGHEELDLKTAEEAYEAVLNKTGATYPRRDAVDARLVADVRNNTGRMINHEKEVGGYPELRAEEAPLDSDRDGIPDEWEIENALNPHNSEDGKEITESGYSNLELYINSLVDMDYVAENPDVELSAPTYNSVHTSGSTVNLKVNIDKKNIEKVEYYKNDEKLGESTKGAFNYQWKDAPEGTWYISARAYDKQGNATQTTSTPIHINHMKQTGDWKSKDIGDVAVKGNLAVSDGQLTVKGAGRIAGKEDSFHFVYQQLRGDGELIARVDSLTKIDNNTMSGVMIRDSLNEEAATAIVSPSLVKAGRNIAPYAVHFSARKSEGEEMIAPGEHDQPEDIGVPLIRDIDLPVWLKIVRNGHTVIGYLSKDGKIWEEVGRKELTLNKQVYIGIAVDGAKDTSQIVNYNTATFSGISLKGQIF